VKCVKAAQAYYHDLETGPIQSNNLGKFYRYVNGNGKIYGRKSIPLINNKSNVGNLVTHKAAQVNIFNRHFACFYT